MNITKMIQENIRATANRRNDEGIITAEGMIPRMDISLTEWNEELHVIPAVHNIEQEISYPGTRVLMKSARKIGAVKEMLMQSDSQVFMVENCGMENERIFTRAEDIPEDASYYSLIIVKNPKK